MSLGIRLRNARKNRGYTQKELAQKIGAKHNSISNWENDQNQPDPATLESLCRVLEVTANYLLLGDSGHPQPAVSPLTDREWELVGKYRGLDTGGRGAVEALLDYFSGLAVKTAPAILTPYASPPALEIIEGRMSIQSVAAGTGTYLEADAFETIRLAKNDRTARASFYVPVAGDSMEPRFHDGDILMVEDAPVKPGEIGVFTLDGSGYVKILGDGELVSLNKIYAPIPMSDDTLCNGKVMGVLDPDWLISNQ